MSCLIVLTYKKSLFEKVINNDEIKSSLDGKRRRKENYEKDDQFSQMFNEVMFILFPPLTKDVFPITPTTVNAAHYLHSTALYTHGMVS